MLQPHAIHTRTLLRLVRALSAADQETVLRFAEFLYARRHVPQPVMTTGTHVILEPRPDNESVVAAIKRLRRSYPMLDTAALFNDVSLLMSAHVLQGRPAPDVIDALEGLFARHFSQWQHAPPNTLVNM